MRIQFFYNSKRKDFDLIFLERSGTFYPGTIRYPRPELDSWEEVVEKTNNIEIKTLLKPSSETRKIDSKCF